MSPMFFAEIFLFSLLGIALISKGSDWFNESLIPLAKKLGVSRISVGLLLVSAAISLPDILLSFQGAVKGHNNIGVGVIFGGIMCNIGLVTGITTFINPLRVNKRLLLRDGIFSIVLPILVLAICDEGHITRLEGLAFLTLFIPYMFNVYLQEKQRSRAQKKQNLHQITQKLNLPVILFFKIKPGWIMFLLGLAGLLFGTHLFSDQLINVASSFKLDEVTVGLTVGALGSALPNIFAGVQAARNGQGELVVSEVVGANIFTLLVTLGVLAMIHPIQITPRILLIDIPSLILMSFSLFFFMAGNRLINRTKGMILAAMYAATILLHFILKLG